MEEKKNSNQTYWLWPALLLGACFVIGCLIVSQTFYRVKRLDDTLSVTGSTKQKVTSDAVKWVSNFSRTVEVSTLKNGYAQMKDDEQTVVAFFETNGFAVNEVTISPISMDQVYKYDSSLPLEYTLRQTVELNSTEVEKVTALAKNIQALIDDGVLFSTQYIEYLYTKLPELRISLLSQAIEDAKLRANEIAQSSDRKINAIRSASIGVVQVLPVNSVEIADYGTYDTSSIEKEVMVTVKAAFSLK
jgi:hypothetical protein